MTFRARTAAACQDLPAGLGISLNPESSLVSELVSHSSSTAVSGSTEYSREGNGLQVQSSGYMDCSKTIPHVSGPPSRLLNGFEGSQAKVEDASSEKGGIPSRTGWSAASDVAVTVSMSPGTADASGQAGFSRSDTLLSFNVSHTRNAADLKILMGNTNARLKPGAAVQPVHSSGAPASGAEPARPRPETLSLEQAKSRARVEVDIILEANTCVQGDYLRGHIKLRVRKRSKKEAAILLAGGKIRVIGFECIPAVDKRYTFYQCASPLSTVTQDLERLYATPPDAEGFAPAIEGVHVLQFAMHLPLDSTCGAPKGVLSVHSGVAVQYIAMISVKVKDADTGKRSVAHFYRGCEIWPRLDPSVILASAPRPLQAATSKSLSMLSSNNKVKLTALVHRLTWLAGQRCYVKLAVVNETKKTIKVLTLTLIRTTTIFKPKPALDAGHARSVDPDSCQTTTTHKVMAESVLEMAQRGTKGHASAKGWWTGVGPGKELSFSHFILLPPDAVSIPRGRLLEVEYSIRVTLSAGTLSSDITVTLPIRIINFLSIDPTQSSPYQLPSGAHVRPLQRRRSIDCGSEARAGHANPWAAFGQEHFRATLSSQSTIHDVNAEELLDFYQRSRRTNCSSTPRETVAVCRESSTALRVTNPDRHPSEISVERPTADEDSDRSVYSSDISSTQSDTEGLAYSSSAIESRGLGNLDLDDPDSDEEVGRVVGSARVDAGETEDEPSPTVAGPEYGSCASRVSIPRPAGPRVESHLRPGSQAYRNAHQQFRAALDRRTASSPRVRGPERVIRMSSFSRRVKGKLANLTTPQSETLGAGSVPATEISAGACADSGDGDSTPRLAHRPDLATPSTLAVPRIHIHPLRPARHPNRRPPASCQGPTDGSQGGSVYNGQPDLCLASGPSLPCGGNTLPSSTIAPISALSRRLPPPPAVSILALSLPASTLGMHGAAAVEQCMISNRSVRAHDSRAFLVPAVSESLDTANASDLSASAVPSTDSPLQYENNALARPVHHRHGLPETFRNQPEHVGVSSCGDTAMHVGSSDVGRTSGSNYVCTSIITRKADLETSGNPDRDDSQRHPTTSSPILVEPERPIAGFQRTETSDSASSSSSGVRARIAELEERLREPWHCDV